MWGALWLPQPRGSSYRPTASEHSSNGRYVEWESGFAWPPHDVTAITQSFEAHSRLRLSAPARSPPTPEEYDKLKAAYWRIGGGDTASWQGEHSTWTKFIDTVNALRKESSTGLGAYQHRSTVGQTLRFDEFGRVVDTSALHELFASVRSRLNELERIGANMASWRDNVPDGVADDSKPFIKDEPHKVSKVQQGRWRVITSFSLEDKIIDGMLFGPWIEDEIRNPLRTVQKAGWAVVPEGYRRLLAEMPNESLCYASDKTAWDWVCPAWVIDYYLDCKLSHHRHEPGHRAAIIARFAYLYGTGFVVRFPDGRRFRQGFYGMMKSGSVLTLSLNSLAQAAMHWLACLRAGERLERVWALGDDFLAYTREGFPAARIDQLVSEMGAIVKFSVKRREFAGMLIRGDGLEPLWQSKHKFIIAHLPPADVRGYLMDLLVWYARSRATWFKDLSARYGISEGAYHAARSGELLCLSSFVDE